MDQQLLQELSLDGWLLYDFRHSNRLACKFLDISDDAMLTRRLWYWIPAEGEPVKVVHKIESHHLDHLPGSKKEYASWKELDSILKELVSGRIAMETSVVDAETVDRVRGAGAEVVSSADLLVRLSAWDQDKLDLHLQAAQVVDEAVAKAWAIIEPGVTEYEVQQCILEEFARCGCITADTPICAVNEHSADPHYMPTADNHATIRKGDFILIDLWCKRDLPRATYADITRVGVLADAPTDRQREIFDIVKAARDASTNLVRERYAEGKPVAGWEVDRIGRDLITDAGYGDNFVHRTGHNIDETDHGDGANIDDFESHEERLLLPGTCFSIEPGIYLPGEFGVRLEYDVVIGMDGSVTVTGGIQDAIECLVS